MARVPHYGLFPCAGGSVLALAIVDEAPFWHGLTRALDLPDLAGLNQADRCARDENIRNRLREIFRARPAREWQELLLAHDVPCGVVLSPGEAMREEHVQTRGMLHPTAVDGGRATVGLRTPGIPASPHQRATAPPEPGEHTEEILQEIGYSAEAIRRLRFEHVVFGPVGESAQRKGGRV
jgi:crotonobetainyl-CoA:carnitine CoA-transferase CaiB-like acyl-CoA transferase